MKSIKNQIPIIKLSQKVYNLNRMVFTIIFSILLCLLIPIIGSCQFCIGKHRTDVINYNIKEGNSLLSEEATMSVFHQQLYNNPVYFYYDKDGYCFAEGHIHYITEPDIVRETNDFLYKKTGKDEWYDDAFKVKMKFMYIPSFVKQGKSTAWYEKDRTSK